MKGLSIQVENLGKRFRLGVGAGGTDTLRDALARVARPRANDQRHLWALRGVDLEVDQGESLGIVGPNGAGKSTLLRILARIIVPTEGIARTRGSVGALLDVGTGFHNELTGRENIYLNGTVLGMRRSQIRARFDEITEFSGVERFLDTPVKRYSEGMRLRLAFSVAAHLEPPIVVVDEVLAVGDATFRQKCMGKIAEMGHRDRTVLLVSHDLGAITQICRRAVWLQGGRVQSDGPAREIVSAYLQKETPGELLDVEFNDESSAQVTVRRATVREVATGRVLAVPERGQPFTVEVTFTVRDVVPDVDFSLILVDELGVVIIDDALRDRPVATPPSGEPGTYVVAATIPPLLPVGSYALRCWIGNNFEDMVERELLTIRVRPRPDDPDMFAERTRAVQPDITWTVRSDAPL